MTKKRNADGDFVFDNRSFGKWLMQIKDRYYPTGVEGERARITRDPMKRMHGVKWRMEVDAPPDDVDGPEQ